MSIASLLACMLMSEPLRNRMGNPDLIICPRRIIGAQCAFCRNRAGSGGLAPSPNVKNRQNAEHPTAKAAIRIPTAVTAVPESAESRISLSINATTVDFRETSVAFPLTAAEEMSIRTWLERINETDALIIASLLEQCSRDAEKKKYFLLQAAGMPES